MPNEHPSSATARRAWLASILLNRPEGFFSRLAAGAARWRDLSRTARQRIRSAVGRRRSALAAAALMLALAGSPLLVPTARAATITVSGGCSLVAAIQSANSNTSVSGCASGAPGLDTIELTADITLTVAGGDFDGDTGLPAVTSEIVIEGNGHTITRAGGADEFRILYVGETGDLTLNDVTISNGEADSFDDGGGFLLRGGALALYNSTISDNIGNDGGGGFNDGGNLTITDSVFRGNYARSDNGGGLNQTQSDDEDHPVVTTTITNSLFENNEAANDGGAIFVELGELTVTDTTISGGKAEAAPGINIEGDETTVTITGSTITNNGYTNTGGGVMVSGGEVDIVNTTISGNSVFGDGGGIANYGGRVNLINATVTDNYSQFGSGITQRYSADAEMTISRSIVSGNGHEIAIHLGTVMADDHNVFGHAGLTSAAAFTNFTPGASDVTATSDGTAPTALAAILDPALADNGGPTLTHNLVDNSPAVDLAPNANCIADPTGGKDQRGRFRPFNVLGQGNEGYATCDAGALEYKAFAVGAFMSTTAPGVTDDGVAFGGEDILLNSDGDWSIWFDGSAAGLTPSGSFKHNINAFWILDPAYQRAVMSFTQNARAVPGIPGKVDGVDLVLWDETFGFNLLFDGQAVGLNVLTNEKIDGLHILPGDMAPPEVEAAAGGPGVCVDYLLISTQGSGRVQNYDGQPLRFGGEDVLGFCATHLASATAGKWHLLLDGSDQGMPRNSTDSISVSADGNALYLTTRGGFHVDAAHGGHSMVYAYDMTTTEFSGPLFVAADEGLNKKVDGLQVNGELP